MSTPSHPDYWDDFYSQGGPGYVDTYEWYLLYSDIRPFLREHLREGQRVLHIGCGNSVVGERMVTDEELPMVTVLNIDNCELIIEKMRERQRTSVGTVVAKQRRDAGKRSKGRNKTTASERAGEEEGADSERRCTYEVMDVGQLMLEDSSFDVCLDKGCLDALLSTGEDEEGTNETIQQMMREVYRVLKPGSKFLIFSKNDSFITNPYFYFDDEIDWEVEANTFDRSASAAHGKASGSFSERISATPSSEGGPGGSTLARTFYLYVLSSCKPPSS